MYKFGSIVLFPFVEYKLAALKTPVSLWINRVCVSLGFIFKKNSKQLVQDHIDNIAAG